MPYPESTSDPTNSIQFIAYIHKKTADPMNMDAKEYARIADLLSQITGKIDRNLVPTTAGGKQAVNTLSRRLDAVVRALDMVAWLDDRGHL